MIALQTNWDTSMIKINKEAPPSTSSHIKLENSQISAGNAKSEEKKQTWDYPSVKSEKQLSTS